MKNSEVMKFRVARLFSSRTRLGTSPDALIPELSRAPSSVLKHETPKLAFGLPLDEDLKAGAISKTIRNQWSNVPQEVRHVMQESRSTSALSNIDLLSSPSSLAEKANQLLAVIGKGPADLQLHRKDYCSSLDLVKYQKGMKAAYHYPRTLVPRTVAARCPGNMRVDPVESDRSVLLLDQLMDRTTVVFCFSGYDLSGLNTGVRAWKEVLEGSNAQQLFIHMCQDWLSRRTHPLTRQILRSFRSEDLEPTRRDKVLVYRGKMSRDIVLDFHAYNKSLPSVLFIDKLGYIRWHAVGLPTEESAELATLLLNKLVRERM